MKRWLFSRRMREAEKAWAIYRSPSSTDPMPVLFHAGFSMGVVAAQAEANTDPSDPS